MTVDRVLLAEPRGFCAGVEMAIKALAWMVRSFEPPVYCYHEIVHNQLIVDRFERQGVVFVDDIADVPPGSPIMLSAHGSAPEVVEAARARGSYVVDSVCPLVTKVHHEVKVRAGKGYRIVYVGHEGHEEAVGTMAVAPGSISRVESVAEVDALPQFDEPVALLAQTTLSHRDWEDVAVRVSERFPDVWTPGRSDLCFATTNRQSALMAMAPAVRRDRGDRVGQLVEHEGAPETGGRSRMPAVFRINYGRRAPRRPRRDGGCHGRCVGTRGARRRGHRRARAVVTAWSSCRSPTRTSTSHHPATFATCRARSKRPARPCSVGRSSIGR